MALDIAPAPPGQAPGLAPGVLPVLPGATAGPFAALLALQVQAKATGPPQIGETVIGLPPTAKSGKDDKAEPESEANALLVPTINPNIIPPPAPPGGLAQNPADPTVKTTNSTTKEVMDTLPANVPGQAGNSSQASGSLLQTTQPNMLVATAAVSTASASTKPVLPTGKLGLQNLAEPANNTGKAQANLALTVAKTKASLAAAVLQNSSPQPREASLTVEDLFAAQDAPPPKGKNGPALMGLLTSLPAPVIDTSVSNASQPIAPLAPADRAALLQQATDAVQTVRVQVGANGQGQMTVQLHPHDWGKLQVSVTMTPTGGPDGGTSVTAHLVADSHAVRAALEDQTSDLRRALSDAGMKLEHLTVSVRSVEASGEARNAGNDAGSNPQSSSGQQWTPPTPTGTGAAGSDSFAGFADRQGFQSPASAPWTASDEDEDAAQPAFFTPAQAGTHGIDVRA